ncbi:MAG: hypothetical protein R3A45_03155 [Bdellovibrionota bacterium]
MRLSFFQFFVPFYFFYAGLKKVLKGDITQNAMILGGIFLCIFVPFRALQIIAHRKVVLNESVQRSMRIGVTMTPTLVFTLVIANILRERFDVHPAVFGSLILYAIFNTMVPSFVP